jgi:prevent-host-death family protein
MEVNIHDAKTNLSKLVAAVEKGEEVIIARNGKPAVQLVRIAPAVSKSRKQILGAGIGKLRMTEDAFSSETDLQIQTRFETDDPLLESGPTRPFPDKKRA